MIDIHSHVANHSFFPKFFTDGIVDSMFINLEKEEQTQSNWDLIERLALNILSDKTGKKQIKQATNAGIEKSILLIVDFFYDEANCNIQVLEQIHEQHYRILEENQDDFIVFSGIDPRRKNGLQLLEKSVKEYGFKGLKLYPPCGFELDDQEAFPYYDFCEQNNIPVLTHTGPSLANMRLSTNFPDSVKKIATEFKNLKIILGHAGILYIEDALEFGKYKNVYVDISGFQREINNIELVENKFKKLFATIPEKVLFGTDWPLFNFNVKPKEWVDKLLNIKALSDQDREMLFELNAKAVLGI